LPAALSNWKVFASEIRGSGITKVVLLGMGGSSLAAEVMSRMLAGSSSLGFDVLDSTDPAAVLRVSRSSPVGKTLFIISSKSGTTTEPHALLEYFWNRVSHRYRRNPGSFFVAITDPGTPLEKLARERGFRRIIEGPPSVGGRYSALSAFGLVPAALLGVDLEGMERGARQSALACGATVSPPRNPGLYLGAVLGAAAVSDRTKLTFLADENLKPFLPWVEQLIAESSGKKGRGLLPLIGEPLGTRHSYNEDRLLIYLRDQGELDGKVRPLIKVGVPVVVVQSDATAATVAAEFYRWEVAVAVACHRIGVNPFNEPDVKSAKDRTAALLEARREGRPPSLPPVLWASDGISVSGKPGSTPSSGNSTLTEVARLWLRRLDPNSLVTFLVFQPGQGKWVQVLQRIRRKSLLQFRLATAAGIGPRYLHSTGQLHKGGSDSGLYLILTARPERDIEIPGLGLAFGDLEYAQAMGDLQALLDAGRIAYGLRDTSHSDVGRLLEALEKAFGDA
jgi:glucose-6-phosphate isomerase